MLTDEERRKIYEEEKARIEAQEALRRGARPKSTGLAWDWLVPLGVVLLFIGVCSLWQVGNKNTPPPARSPLSGSAPVSYGPDLEIISFRWGRTEGGSYAEAKGQVKNISGKSLRSVAAVVTFSDRSGGFITSSDALIDYDPILPGQTSPFSVLETYNPAMRTGTAMVEFKFLMGGTIPTRHSEK